MQTSDKKKILLVRETERKRDREREWESKGGVSRQGMDNALEQ